MHRCVSVFWHDWTHRQSPCHSQLICWFSLLEGLTRYLQENDCAGKIDSGHLVFQKLFFSFLSLWDASRSFRRNSRATFKCLYKVLTRAVCTRFSRRFGFLARVYVCESERFDEKCVNRKSERDRTAMSTENEAVTTEIWPS